MGLFDVVNKVGGALGLGGKQGEYFQPGQLDTTGQRALNSQVDANNSANVKRLMQGMQDGTISLKDALAQATSPDEVAALSSGPVSGSLVAQQQVMEDPLLKGVLGKGGSFEGALGEEKDLANRGYSLQPEDYEAYGQGSDNIARLFAGKESSLASALADRGLASAPSGVAAQQFSGLQGNKFEQLGQLQRSIADDRMSKNLERLNSTRSYINNLTNQAQNAENSAFNRNLNGAQNRSADAAAAAGANTSAYNAQNQAAASSLESKNANKEVGLGDALSKGFMSGVQGGISSATSSLFNPTAAAPVAKKKPTQAGNGADFSSIA